MFVYSKGVVVRIKMPLEVARTTRMVSRGWGLGRKFWITRCSILVLPPQREISLCVWPITAQNPPSAPPRSLFSPQARLLNPALDFRGAGALQGGKIEDSRLYLTPDKKATTHQQRCPSSSTVAQNVCLSSAVPPDHKYDGSKRS